MRKLAVAAALALAFGMSAKANVSGSLGFESATLTQADASPTGNVNTASLFDLMDWTTTRNDTGIFAGLPIQDLGDVMLNLKSPTGFKFGDAMIGTFNSTSITASSTGPGFLDVLAVGKFDPGSIAPGSPPATAEVRIALTQTPPATGAISASGTMSITSTSVVPENSTFFLFGTGLLAMVGMLGIPRLRERFTASFQKM